MKISKKNILLIFLLTLIPFLWGVSTVYLKIFPFNELQTVKNFVFPEISNSNNVLLKKFYLRSPNPNKNRILSLPYLKEFSLKQSNFEINKSLVFVTFGQSNSVNHGQIGYVVRSPVYMVHQGRIYSYEEPALGGTGKNGSVWGMVGDKIIERSDIDSVYFTMTGFGGVTMEELNTEIYFNYFIDEIKNTKNLFGKVDGILIHQGEANHANLQGSEEYFLTFKQLFSKINEDFKVPIFLSQTSLCGANKTDPELLAIQNRIIVTMQGVLRGPNADSLHEPKYRLPDRCHFSMLGFDSYSNLWVSRILTPSEK